MLGVECRRIGAMNSQRRPDVLPGDRFEVLRIMRLMGWSAQQAATRFVLHVNTIRDWKRKFLKREDVGGFFGPAPFNKLNEAVRWLVHEMRRMCPHLALGTRTIARMIVQAGLRISRSSVQRILREEPPKKRVRRAVAPGGTDTIPYNVLAPRQTNRTWHLDLTVVTVLWCQFHIAALMDGFSRKLLTLRVFARTPTWKMMAALVRQAIIIYGKPRFLVTDHGCQFRRRFRKAVKQGLGIQPVRGKVRSWTFNGKVERFFRTMKLWWRLSLFPWAYDKLGMARKMQVRLDIFQDWFNTRRVHQALGGLTPEQVWTESSPPTAVAIRAGDPQPDINILRHRHRGDPHLPDLELEIEWAESA
jgi:transposase InsO family protein